VFGHINRNRSLRRFALAAIAHNFLKQEKVNRLFRGTSPNKKTSRDSFNHDCFFA
jgi:hypothetical protein